MHWFSSNHPFNFCNFDNYLVLVTIARAIELKHNPGLISALSKETATMYTTAHDSLESLDPKIFGHWKMYFGLKAKFYLAYVSPKNIREPTNSLKHDINN